MNPASNKRFHTLFILLLAGCTMFSGEYMLAQANDLDAKNLEQTMRNPWKPDRSEFIKEWLILGPIPASSTDDLDTDFLSQYRGEANIEPSQGDRESIRGNGYSWRAAKCKDIVDLRTLYEGGRTEDAVAYACATINRKETGALYFSLGSDDGIKVWFNGTIVHRMARLRGLTLDEDAFVVNANKGENRLLLKIQQAKGGWGFAVRLRDSSMRDGTSTKLCWL